MKRIRIQITEEGLPISTIREIAYLKHLEKFDHPNIVKLLDVINGPRLTNEQSVILIFEYIDFDLNNFIKNISGNLNLSMIKDLMKQMLIGVDFLHTNRIIHRDLKPQNVLVTKEGRVKIADFGLARIYGFTMALTSVVVTLWYRSPEVLLHSTYSSSVDMWSLGCIFAELYLKRPLFMGQSDIDQLYKIFEVLGLPSDENWPVNSVIPLRSFSSNANLDHKGRQSGAESLIRLIPALDANALDLLVKLLDFNLTNRMTAKDSLLHSFFSDQEQQQEERQEASVVIPVNLAKKYYATEELDAENCCANDQNAHRIASREANELSTLPDITNLFQPNILKRKRIQQNNK
jgi:serine/threonine protein kinase